MVDGIHEERVTAWLVGIIPDLQLPVQYSLITGGHSNLTYMCRDASGACYVLRRPPLGHVLESAHDMGREHKIIHALQDADIPVPKTWGLCRDIEVNDAPFYVMGFVDGLVLNDSVIGGSVPVPDRHGIGLNVIDILSRLHAINPDDVGLGDLGRKDAYLQRQLKRWNKQWAASKTHEVPEMEESARLLAEDMPEQIGTAIVHGDYRLGNMIVKDDSVLAILDWELCTLGDPLADVGYLLNNWVSPGEIETREGDQSPTAVGSYPSRDELCEIYANKTGRDLSQINYYRAFAHWRLAAIGQGVYKRYLMGAMGKDREVDLDKQKEGVAIRAAAALELLSQ
ncbi:MAG: aminoglycoside phosphotransferase (APT) family kinase protein [Candidatus Azotimanducaceae bacterium]|jgi:aminoglycoside phosphotransferase (APT) family kinase protein